jgi:UDP-N-acetylmuramate dehydrogenase
MFILENVPLSAYSTMKLGGPAAFLTDINRKEEIPQALDWATQRSLPTVMIGAGSNIIWSDDGFKGLVLVNKILGIEEQTINDTEYYLTVGAGMNWDEFVAHTTSKGLSGIEFLSLVPGTVGATPIQNVGAYGQEVANTIATIEAYDTQQRQFVTLRGSECGFGYRTSRFKTTDRGHYMITSITYFLTKANPEPPFYSAVEQYLQEHHITTVTPQVGRDATIAIRRAKLPDPTVVANNGSFFGNPVIDSARYFQLQAGYPDMVHWSAGDNQVKLSAAWLIEQAGFKDYHDPETGMATWAKQPLVLVNEQASSTAQLLQFRQKIIDAVQQKFGVTLEQEPELMPST